MLVVQVSGPYVFVRDPWPGCRLLPVYANCRLEKWWSVEITGITKTISGKRIVRATRIRLYVDSKGRPFRNWPKGPEPREWPYMVEVPIEPSPVAEPPPPEPEPAPLSSPPTPPDCDPESPNYNGIACALRQPVDTEVLIYNTICSADSPSPDPGFPSPSCAVYDFGYEQGKSLFYIQDPETPTRRGRSCGIKVNWDGGTSVWYYPRRGDEVLAVRGFIKIVDGEKQVNATYVFANWGSGLPPVKPLGMNLRALGGASILPGEPGEAPGVKDAYGLYNKGLLIKTTGLVTYVDPAGAFCYIDDGSVMNSQPLSDGNTLGPGGSAAPGVRVRLTRSGPGWLCDDPLPQVGQYIAVTGISSSMIINNEPVRMVRQLSNFGRPISQESTNYTGRGSGRGLIMTSANETYFTVAEVELGWFPPINSLWKHQPGSAPLEYPIDHQLGCLDMDSDNASFWGGLYLPGTGGTARLYQHSMVWPFDQLAEVEISWMQRELDGLAIAPDRTFWVSGDVATRVYHVGRNGNDLGHLDFPFGISGHEFFDDHLWVVGLGPGGYCATINKVDPANGNVLAYFSFEGGQLHVIEDLHWDVSHPKLLRGMDISSCINTWDLTWLQVLHQ
jgi:hypothetical protein